MKDRDAIQFPLELYYLLLAHDRRQGARVELSQIEIHVVYCFVITTAHVSTRLDAPINELLVTPLDHQLLFLTE